METIFLFYLGISCIIFKADSTKTTLSYYKEASTWQDAKRICSDNNGKLMIPHASSLGKLNQTCSVAMNETIWVGEYTSLSEFVEITGCYSEWNTGSSVQKTANDPLLCVHLCQNYTYFGMKEDMCICIEESVFNARSMIDSQNCNYSCNGRKDVFCGGNSSVSIYRKVSLEINDEPKTNCTRFDCFCVSADCQTIGNQIQTAYFSRPCSNDLSTVCGNYEVVTGDAPNWKEAIERCVDQQNSYPVNSDASTSVCNHTAITWTSIFRDVFMATDETGLPVSNIQGCRQMDLRTSSGSSLSNCTEKLPFVCEIVLKPGQPEDLCVSTTVSVTTTETVESTTSETTTTTTEAAESTSSTTELDSTPQEMSTTETSTKQDTTRRTEGPLPGKGSPAAIPQGAVIGASVAAAVVLVVIIGAFVLICRRKHRRDGSFTTDEDDKKELNTAVNPYLTNTNVGYSNPVTEEMTEIRVPSIVVNTYQNTPEPVTQSDLEPLTAEDQVAEKSVYVNVNTGENVEFFKQSPEKPSEGGDVSSTVKDLKDDNIVTEKTEENQISGLENKVSSSEGNVTVQNINSRTNEQISNRNETDNSVSTGDSIRSDSTEKEVVNNTAMKQDKGTSEPVADNVPLRQSKTLPKEIGDADFKDKEPENDLKSGDNIRANSVNLDGGPGKHTSVISIKM